MKRLRHKDVTPSGGWYYVQPETGLRLEAESRVRLVCRVMDHRRWKKLDGVTWEEAKHDVEQFTIARLDPRWHIEE